MIRRVVLLMLLLPVVDLVLLVIIGRRVGVWPTLAYVAVSAILGYALAKRQGLGVLLRMREDLAARRAPGFGLVDGFLILLGGILLVLPGVITDVLGLLLMFPFARNVVKRYVRGILERGLRDGSVRIIGMGRPPGERGHGRASGPRLIR